MQEKRIECNQKRGNKITEGMVDERIFKEKPK